MTLVESQEGNVLPIMLSVQHHHHHGVRQSTSGQNHRSNVIVSTSSMPNNENKVLQHGCKRTKIYGQSNGPYGTVPHQPASVARRNARERNRVKQVNNGFATLRQHIPQSVAQALGGTSNATHAATSRAGSKKLSKVETLRMAVEYIRSLQRLLDDHDGSDITGTHSTSSASSTCSSGTGIGSDATELRLRSVGNDIRHVRQNPSPTFVTPCSEASSSPTPSFVSDGSSAGSQSYGTKYENNGTIYTQDTYDNYEPMSPEDEELLDVISWWQQSQ